MEFFNSIPNSLSKCSKNLRQIPINLLNLPGIASFELLQSVAVIHKLVIMARLPVSLSHDKLGSLRFTRFAFTNQNADLKKRERLREALNQN
jgi:hypothetical protein